MRERSRLLVAASAALVAAGLLVVGCEKSDSKPASSSGTASPTASTPAPKSDAAQAAGEAAREAEAGAQTAGEKVAEGAKGASDAANDAAAGAKADAAGAADAGSAAAGDAQSQATELIKQVTQYVKENKLDLADKAMKQLDALKPQLPAEYHGKIDGARTLLESAKKGQGLKDLLPK